MSDNNDTTDIELTGDDKVRDPFQPHMGEYSNRLSDYEAERRAAREQVKNQVGDYVLSLDPVYPAWSAKRKDGKPVPKNLSGMWKSVGQFRQRLEQLG